MNAVISPIKRTEGNTVAHNKNNTVVQIDVAALSASIPESSSKIGDAEMIASSGEASFRSTLLGKEPWLTERLKADIRMVYSSRSISDIHFSMTLIKISGLLLNSKFWTGRPSE